MGSDPLIPITGMVTKPGRYKVTVHAYDMGNPDYVDRIVKNFVVRDSGSVYMPAVELANGSTDLGGTAKGGGKVVSVGTKLPISAKAPKGYVFAGWYTGANCLDGERLEGTASGDWRKASDSVMATADLATSKIWARFCEEDVDLVDVGSGTWEIDPEDESTFEYEVAVGSESFPTVTVKGLPAGVKHDKKAGKFYVPDASKLKPGKYIVTISAKNVSKHTDSGTVTVTVPNLYNTSVFSYLNYGFDYYNLTVGTTGDCNTGGVEFSYDTDYKVTAKGLPAGVKLVLDEGDASLEGVPTKAGVYNVTLTAKKGKETATATFTVNVAALLESAVGTYNGIVIGTYESGGKTYPNVNNVLGSCVFTLAANGKQTFKFTGEEGTFSLANKNSGCIQDGEIFADFYKDVETKSLMEAIEVLMVLDTDGVVWNSKLQTGSSDYLYWRKEQSSKPSFELDGGFQIFQRNPFSKTNGAYDNPLAVSVAESLASSYKSAVHVVQFRAGNVYDLIPEGSSYIDSSKVVGSAKVTANKNGTVKVAGKIDGKSFSATATLVFDDGNYYVIFTPDVRGVGLRAMYWEPYKH